MSRIRSIHPGLWTDEAFASLPESDALLYIGLLNEADDNGVFEWKPITIKMRLKPASAHTSSDIEATLRVIQSAGMIRHYEFGGKHYGAIRNFVKWQRPKQPKSTHPVPPEITSYLGFDADGKRPRALTGRPPSDEEGERLPNPRETASEQARQRKEEGGRREEKHIPPPIAPGGVPVIDRDISPASVAKTTGQPKLELDSDDTLEIPAALDRRKYPEAFENLWRAYRPIASPNATKADAHRAWTRLSPAERQMCFDGLNLYVKWLGAERLRRPEAPAKHLATFVSKRGWEPFLERATGVHGKATPPKDDHEAEMRLSVGRDLQMWPTPTWGPAPNAPGCLIPSHLITPTDGAGWGEWVGGT